MSLLWNKLKTSVVITSAILVLFSGAFPALAVGPVGPVGPTGPTGPVGTVGPTGPTGPVDESTLTTDQTNSDTGANSNNENTSSTNTDVDATIDNNATINNDLTFNADSGNNTTTQNSLVGNVDTGNITGSVNIVNIANSTLGDGSSIGAQTIDGTGLSTLTLDTTDNRTQLNTGTGSGSDNSNTTQNNNNLTLVNNNNATANNNIVVNANTGLNDVSRNTQVGDISTGDIAIDVNVFNLLNVFMPDTQLTLDVWSIYGFMGDILIPASNELTGANSTNTNTSNTTTNANVSFNQNADINNDVDLNCTTGNNTISNNTSTGLATTGECDTNASITNIANDGPVIYWVRVFGDFLGGVFGGDGNVMVTEMGNEATGANSTNTNTSDTTNNIDATINNNAVANNNITVNANTGGNTITDNTMTGAIDTGNVRLTSNVVNVLNSVGSNLSKYTLRIVNIFGNWGGSVKTAPVAATSTGGSTATLVSQPVAAASTADSIGAASTTGAISSPAPKKSSPLGKLVSAVTHPGGSAAPATAGAAASGATTSSLVASASTAGDGGIMVKSYTSRVASQAKRGISADLIKVLLIALAIILLWGGIEYASVRSKKQVK